MNDRKNKIIDERKDACPYRTEGDGCGRYSGCTGFCDGACAFVVDYLNGIGDGN